MRASTTSAVLPKPITLLKEFIEIPSLFSQSPYETVIARTIEQYLIQMGFHVTRQPIRTPPYKLPETPERYNLLAEKGVGDISLLLYGHMDTFNIVDGWQRNPVVANHEGDRIYGLGAYHGKAGLSAILQAVKDVQPEGYTLKLAFLADEKNLQVGAYTLGQSLWMKDVYAAITPEAETLDITRLGPKSIQLGRRGHITIQIMIHSIHGKSVSAYLGQNILIAAIQLLTILESERQNREALDNLEAAAFKRGFSIRAFHSEPRCNQIVPENATIVLDRHLAPKETREDACNDIRRIIATAFAKLPVEFQARLSYTITLPDAGNPYILPYITNVNHPFVHMVKTVVKKRVGMCKLRYNQFSTPAEKQFDFSHSEIAESAPPTVIISPSGGEHHAHDEWVSVQSLHDLIGIYQEVIQEFEELTRI